MKDGEVADHDELACITDACAMYETILSEVETDLVDSDSPEEELRRKMPRLLGALSPEALALVADHLRHVQEIVAHVHRLEAAYRATNRSSA